MQNKHNAQEARRRPWAAARAMAAGLSMVAVGAAWAAPTVLFVATDLTDTTSGQDLWRYDYTLSGPVDSFGSVNLLFSPANYANLMSQTLDTNLTLLDVQPDAGLPADGIVYVTALNGLLAGDTASLSVDFVWLGASGTKPGAQAFEVVDGAGSPAGGGMSQPLSGGTVPEPSALLLSFTALLALSAKRKQRSQA